MAMPKWTDYTTKTEPADNDEVMVLDTAGKANKRLGLSALSDWIIGKIANKVFENLQTQNKTILGALNELNNKPQIIEFSGNIDSLNGRCIVVANANATGTLPTGLSGNRYLIICDSVISSGRIIYGVQMALSFGSSSIAVRNCGFNNAGSTSYDSWRYI